jgi:glutamine synthetase
MELNTIRHLLDRAAVKFVRVLWCDNANVIRGKAIHTGRLDAYLAHGVGISPAQQAIPVMYDVPVAEAGLTPVGEIRLLPDWDTLRVLPYAPGHARVLGDMVDQGMPWPLCPRDFLRRMIAAAAAAGIEVVAAFENEFYLLQQAADGMVPADNTVFASTTAMDRHYAVIGAIADALLDQGIVVEQYYPESGPGQQELSMLYAPALIAADRQIVFRETVRAIAHQHQLRASFLPKLFADQAGSGCHLHMSLWRDGVNLVPDLNTAGQLSPVASEFVAGVQHHLPALMALTTPSPNSYRRIAPHSWSGAYNCWGVDNREAAIRVPSNPAPPSPTHVELKTMDAAANPYLALGAVIAAGLDGVKTHQSLDKPVQCDPGVLSASERRGRGIQRLPETLGVTIEHLSRDDVLLAALGPALAKAYIAVRQAEWEAMQDYSLDDEVALLLERY